MDRAGMETASGVVTSSSFSSPSDPTIEREYLAGSPSRLPPSANGCCGSGSNRMRRKGTETVRYYHLLHVDTCHQYRHAVRHAAEDSESGSATVSAISSAGASPWDAEREESSTKASPSTTDSVTTFRDAGGGVRHRRFGRAGSPCAPMDCRLDPVQHGAHFRCQWCLPATVVRTNSVW